MVRRSPNDACRIGPEGVRIDLAGAVFDGVPIDEAAITSIAHDAAEPLVLVEQVFQQGAGNELIEQLAQSEREALRQIFADDRVGLLHDSERGGMWLVGNEHLGGHCRQRACV